MTALEERPGFGSVEELRDRIAAMEAHIPLLETAEEASRAMSATEAMLAWARSERVADIAVRVSVVQQRLKRHMARFHPKQTPGPADSLSGAPDKLSKQRRAELRKLASVPDDEFESLAAEAVETLTPLTTSRVLAAASKHAVPGKLGRDLRTGHPNDSLYTPGWLVDLARETLGGIDLDPASCAEANQTVRASTYFTADDDGLEQPWAGRVWMNPPWSQKAAFVDKLLSSGGVTAWVVLVSLDFSASLTHRLVAAADWVWVPARRPVYTAPGGGSTGWFASAMHGRGCSPDAITAAGTLLRGAPTGA